MNDDPLLELIQTALNLMNKSFVDAAEPRTLAMEFYHQFRKLWDRAIPVGMKLGHLTTIAVPGVDVAIQRLGEHGRPTERLAAIQFSPTSAIDGFLSTFAVVTQPTPPADGVTTIVFDVKRWACAS